MAEEDDLPDVPKLVRVYFALVQVATGRDPAHWDFARALHYTFRRLIERHYFGRPDLSSAETSELFTALEELHKCPLKQVGQLGAWWQVQMRLRHVMPLVERLLAQ
jgi:hypothetical protein